MTVMSLLRDGRDVQVSEDEVFLKDEGDLMVFSDHNEHLPVTRAGASLKHFTAYYQRVKVSFCNK